ncbi:MAG: hypothetical protein J6A46_05025 [Clostridia bacterium]|nr:hypothetical protein [Clostridia bacterium]
MKKLFTMFMALCMCLGFGFAATACEELPTDSIPIESTPEESTPTQGNTVTDEQWENAIKEESFQNVTFTQYITLFGATELVEDFTIKMTENAFFMKGSVTSNRNPESNANGAIYYADDDALELKKIYTDSFNEEFTNYALFHYKEEEDFYVCNRKERTIWEDETVLKEVNTTTKVRFNESGQIVLITVSFQQKSGSKEINGTARFLFSNYGTTAITNEEILSASNSPENDAQSPIYPTPL